MKNVKLKLLIKAYLLLSIGVLSLMLSAQVFAEPEDVPTKTEARDRLEQRSTSDFVTLVQFGESKIEILEGQFDDGKIKETFLKTDDGDDDRLDVLSNHTEVIFNTAGSFNKF